MRVAVSLSHIVSAAPSFSQGGLSIPLQDEVLLETVQCESPSHEPEFLRNCFSMGAFHEA